MKIVALKGSTDQPWTGFLFRTEDGHIIAFDGGCRGDVDNSLEELKKLCGEEEPHIDLWLISHPHGDHYGTLRMITYKGMDGEYMPEIKCLAYYPLPDSFGKTEEWCEEQMIEFNKVVMDNPCPKYHLTENSVFTFGNLKIECLLVTDENETVNAFNNASCVFKMTEDIGDKQFTMMLLGDLGVEGSKRLLAAHKDDIKSIAVQVSHHGQKGCTRDVYEAIKPRYAFWFTPDWLWNSEGSELSTVNTRKWLEEIGAEAIVPQTENIILDSGDLV